MLGFFCQDTMTGKLLGKAIAELLVCPLIRLSDKGSVPFSDGGDLGKFRHQFFGEGLCGGLTKIEYFSPKCLHVNFLV